MKKILFSVVIAALAITCYGQSVVGVWKRTATTLEYQSGKKEDLQKTMQANLPCLANTKYYFKADGTHSTQSAKGCETIDAMSTATWKQTGNRLTMTTKQETKLKTPGTTFTVSFSGNTMTLAHTYTDEENKVSNTKVKQIITVYQRL